MLDCNSVSDYFSQEKLECSICMEPFDFEERKPSQVCSNGHNACMKCFEELRKVRRDCPECRAPLNFQGSRILPNGDKIKMMEIIKKQFEDIQALKAKMSASQQAPVQPVAHVPIELTLEVKKPDNFQIVTFAEEKFNLVDTAEIIRSIYQKVADAMNWSTNRDTMASFWEDFKPESQEWVLFVDKHTKEGIGFAKFIKSNENGFTSHTKYEAHWTGIVKKDDLLYYEIYKEMILYVASKRPFPTEKDWYDYSIKSHFNFDNAVEEAARKKIVVTLETLKYRVSSPEKVRWFAQTPFVQKIVETFPFAKAGHEQVELTRSQTVEMITERTNFSERVASRVEKCLTPSGIYFENNEGKLGLSLLMSDYARAMSRQPNIYLDNLRAEFRKNPENTFLYVVDRQVRGYIKFSRQNDQLNVDMIIGTNDEKYKIYIDHFILQFQEWAMTKQSYSRNKSAKSVNYVNCIDDVPRYIQQAICRNQIM